MEEITNAVWISCLRTSAEIAEACTDEQIDATLANNISKMSKDEKRNLVSYILAKDMFNELGNMKQPTEEG